MEPSILDPCILPNVSTDASSQHNVVDIDCPDGDIWQRDGARGDVVADAVIPVDGPKVVGRLNRPDAEIAAEVLEHSYWDCSPFALAAVAAAEVVA